eukprot:gene23596-biopygen18124
MAHGPPIKARSEKQHRNPNPLQDEWATGVAFIDLSYSSCCPQDLQSSSTYAARFPPSQIEKNGESIEFLSSPPLLRDL